jgi:opacity protein-like surface antigen
LALSLLAVADLFSVITSAAAVAAAAAAAVVVVNLSSAERKKTFYINNFDSGCQGRDFFRSKEESKEQKETGDH